jgi:plastocyanin
VASVTKIRAGFMVLAAGALLSMSAPAESLPAAVHVVALPNGTTTGFAPNAVAILKGTGLDVLGADLQVHNLACVKRNRKTKRPLCQSEYVAAGESKPLVGAEKLPPGDYGLLCQLHPQMKAKLTVVG